MKKPSVLIIWLTVFIDLIGFGIVVPLVPLFSKQFGAHGIVIGVIIASFSASDAGQSFSAARWARPCPTFYSLSRAVQKISGC
jgi:hypothetical protein